MFNGDNVVEFAKLTTTPKRGGLIVTLKGSFYLSRSPQSLFVNPLARALYIILKVQQDLD